MSAHMAPKLHFTGKHWTAIGVFLVSISTLIGAEPDWQHVFRPTFIGALSANVGGFLIAMFSDKQPSDRVKSERFRRHL